MAHNNCQCEHSKHFEDHSPAHPYGADVSRTVPVKTTMGVFHVCSTCASTCYGPDSGVRAS